MLKCVKYSSTSIYDISIEWLAMWLFLLFETFFLMLVTNIAVHLSFRTPTEKQHNISFVLSESQHHVQKLLICKKCKDTETINYELDTNTAKNSSEHVSTQWPSAYRRNMSMCCTKTGNFGWDSPGVFYECIQVFFSSAHLHNRALKY